MKLSVTSCIVLAASIAKVSADCFSTALGYPCCTNTVNVVYTDSDGQWGVENNNWCGIQSQAKSGLWTGQNQGYPACGHCIVTYVDGDGKWGVQDGNWCGLKNTCDQQTQPQQPVQPVQPTQPTQPEPVQPTQPEVPQEPAKPASKYPDNPPPVSGGATGVTTRYWDCCVASCSWKENTNAEHPVNVCQKDGKTVYPKFDWTIGNVCDGGKQGYMCNDNQPWAINEKLAYGFAAASLSGQGSQKDWCCSCQRLEFTSGPVKGKQMVVQVTNTGGDLG
jgi:Glycosyl hydrolase family 45./Cellulose or protein binding domain.